VSYKVNRNLGFERWGVTNPWVFANYGQPQRQRGYVSPGVFQTAGPYLKSVHLGVTETESALLRRADVEMARGERMERLAMLGVAISVTSLLMTMWKPKRSTR